jgi:hypothetical protein
VNYKETKLTSAVPNNSKTNHGKDYRKDWAAATGLVAGQTLHSSIDQVQGRTGKWTTEEDDKLKDAVQFTIARIGMQSPVLCQIERDVSVSAGGRDIDLEEVHYLSRLVSMQIHTRPKALEISVFENTCNIP